MEFPLLLPQDSLGLFSPPLFMSVRFLKKGGVGGGGWGVVGGWGGGGGGNVI